MKIDTATLFNDPEEIKSLILDLEETRRSRVEYLEEKVRPMALLQKDLLPGPITSVDAGLGFQPARPANHHQILHVVVMERRFGKADVSLQVSPHSFGRCSPGNPQGLRGLFSIERFPRLRRYSREMPGIVLVGYFAHVRGNLFNVMNAQGHEKKKKTSSANGSAITVSSWRTF